MSLFHPHLAAVGEWEAASASTEMLQRCTTVTASVKSDLIERYFTLFHYSEGSSVQKDTLQQRNTKASRASGWRPEEGNYSPSVASASGSLKPGQEISIDSICRFTASAATCHLAS